MTKVDVGAARAMREQGMTLQAIGDRFGVSREWIRQLVGSPLRSRACDGCSATFETKYAQQRFCSGRCRERARAVAVCDCGEPKSAASQQCYECSMRDWELAREVRWARIRALWLMGLPMDEMAERLGYANRNVLGVQMARMKHAGWDLPYRRKGWAVVQLRGPRATEEPPQTKTESRRRFAHAIRSGKVTRPAACERCGRETYVDGHHHDYSKPLEVEWLCRPCHMAHHATERQAA